MASHLELSLQRDLDRIRSKITEMGTLAEQALNDCVKAVLEGNRQLAYSVILRDQYIDEKEKEIDRLCLEFLVRQQPVAGNLRFVYSTIRVNLELERVGDYAESVARQALKLGQLPVDVPREWFTEIAQHSVAMLREALKAFITQDADLARSTIEIEAKVDLLRNKLIKDLVNLFRENKIPFEALDPLTLTVRRIERVGDQARNICMETIYSSTGEYSKHPNAEVFRVLFVDEHDACTAKIAEAVATSLNQSKFIFASAGLDPHPIAPATANFLQEKGLDASRLVPRSIHQVPNIEFYHLIIALAPGVKKAFPRHPRKGVYLEWTVPDPCTAVGSPDEMKAAYEACYQLLKENINEITQAILRS